MRLSWLITDSPVDGDNARKGAIKAADGVHKLDWLWPYKGFEFLIMHTEGYGAGGACRDTARSRSWIDMGRSFLELQTRKLHRKKERHRKKESL